MCNKIQGAGKPDSIHCHPVLFTVQGDSVLWQAANHVVKLNIHPHYTRHRERVLLQRPVYNLS
jgi:hypothetical protein